MTPLEQRLRRQIALSGPIRFDDYWAQCLFDPQHGYYTTRIPIGASGDFTTAPEISQMFGELLAAWWLAAVRQNGLADCALVEIGPGRGTLMTDMLRTLARLDPSLPPRLPVHMVEVSPMLTAVQQQRLDQCGFTIRWHDSLSTLPAASMGIIANELFDAIPVRPFIHQGGHWHERAVTVDPAGKLACAAIPIAMDPALVDIERIPNPNGTVFEHAPAREAFMRDIARRLQADGGFGLFIDYGHARSACGDTVQALKNHAYCDPLASPGLADITSHVDFEALTNAARREGAAVSDCVEQGAFLTRLGIRERATQLANARPALRDSIETACDRLIGGEQMGRLFKVLAVARQGLSLPGFEHAS